mmetsp:Transcript_109599/g.172830  ORF Transcript_109599/g.172830 Transcript_109599/m.172830 type:complete len:149 (-) Transcript_109599:72-518(-)
MGACCNAESPGSSEVQVIQDIPGDNGVQPSLMISKVEDAKLGQTKAQAQAAKMESFTDKDSTNLKITFRTKTGENKTITLEKSPFGMTYATNKFPVVITKFTTGSIAQSLGVQIGWEIMAINGNDVSAEDFATVDALLREASKRLRPQ